MKVISRLYHPNVVEVGISSNNDGTYLVMELLHSVDLLESLIRTQDGSRSGAHLRSFAA